MLDGTPLGNSDGGRDAVGTMEGIDEGAVLGKAEGKVLGKSEG